VLRKLLNHRDRDPLRGIAFGEDWLRKRAGTGSVYRHLSLLYDDVHRRGEALAVARRGFALHPNDRKLAACLANYLAKVEGADAALGFAGSHPNFFSNDAYCRNTLADGLSSSGAYQESAKIFESLFRRDPANPKLLGSLLDAWFHLGRYADVVAEVERWEKRNSMNGQLANEAGRACLDLGRGEEGLTWIRRAMKLAPDNSKYADNYAVAFGRAGRHEEGIRAAQQRLASSNSPDRSRLLASIGIDHTCLGRHEEALKIYQQAFAEFPESRDALVNLMVGLNWLDRYDETAALAQSQQERRGTGFPQRFWSEFAWALHQTNRFDSEENVAREWGRLYPHDPDAVRAAKRALNALKRQGEALTVVRTWVDGHPHVAWGWRYLAEQNEVCGNPADEVAAVAEASRLQPDSADFKDIQLMTLRRIGRAQEAMELGIAWDRAFPRLASPALLNRIGLAADDIEQWPTAEIYYRRAHDAEPAESTWTGNLMRALICQKRAAEAAGLGRAWLAAHPWHNYVVLKQAWALRESDLLPEETGTLRSAVEKQPQDEELNYALLTNLIARKLYDEAAVFMAQCEKTGIASSRFFNDWANSLNEQERFDDAEAGYRRALELAPENATAAGNLISFLTVRDRADAALEFALAWIDRHPDHHYVRRQLAHVYYTVDDYPAAEAEYRKLTQTEPDSAHLFGRLIACLRLQGKFEEALGLSELWLKTHDGTSFLLTEMGISAHRLGRCGPALKYFDAALQFDATVLPTALGKLRVLAEQGPASQALQFGAEWAAAHPTDSQFENELAIVADRAGDLEQAQRRFLRAVELDPENPTLAGNAVEVLCRQGAISESIQLGQGLLAKSPPNAYLLRRLAEAYCAHHEYLAAVDLLSSADALEPDDSSVALALMRAAYNGGEAERGIEFGRTWLARPGNERRAAAWVQFARLCFRADYDDEAFRALQTAIDLEPNEIGHVRLRFGFWSALEDSTRIVTEFGAIRPEWRSDADLLRQVSQANHELGLSAEALDLAVQNVGANPGDADAAAWLAELHLRCDRLGLARDCIREWVAIHGEQMELIKVRAKLALQEKCYADALRDAETILAQDPSDEDSFVISIRALRASEREGEARSRLHRWIEHERTSSRVSALLDEDSSSKTE
jgi:tetratricopeptide (TPR) repeat protein